MRHTGLASSTRINPDRIEKKNVYRKKKRSYGDEGSINRSTKEGQIGRSMTASTPPKRDDEDGKE